LHPVNPFLNEIQSTCHASLHLRSDGGDNTHALNGDIFDVTAAG
jgi:hypothetical protein